MKKEEFNVQRFLSTLADGSKYLEVKYRIEWFRTIMPMGGVTTELVKADFDDTNERCFVIFKATISNENGGVLAVGYASKRGTTKDKYSVLESAETAAVGRALHFAGYCPVECTGEDSETTPCDAPIRCMNEKQASKKEEIKQQKPVIKVENNAETPEKTVAEYEEMLTQTQALQVQSSIRSATGMTVEQLLADPSKWSTIEFALSDAFLPKKEAGKKFKAACIVIKPQYEKMKLAAGQKAS